MALLASTGFFAGTTRPARTALGKALFIAGCQFALYLTVASRIGRVRLPLAIDFPTFYFASVIYRAGGNPYDLSLLGELAKGTGTNVYPFLYPPTSLPAFFPLGLAGIDASQIIFQLVSFLCLVYVLFVVIRTAEEEQLPKSWRLVSLVALMGFYAIYSNFLHGQVNTMATAAIVFAWMKARANSGGGEVACAAALLIAILLKTYPVLLLMPFLIRRDFKVVAWVAIFAAGDALLSFITIPREAWQTWIFKVMPTGRFGITPYGLSPLELPYNQSLNGALSRVLGDRTTAELGPLVQVLVLGLTVIAVWTFRRQSRREFYDLGFGATIVASCLIAPLSWFHHFVFLIPALAAFASILNLTEWRDSIVWTSSLLLITVMISVRWPIAMGDYRTAHPLMRLPILGNFALDPRAAHALMTVPSLGPLALFAMFAALSFELWRRGASLDRCHSVFSPTSGDNR